MHRKAVSRRRQRGVRANAWEKSCFGGSRAGSCCIERQSSEWNIPTRSLEFAHSARLPWKAVHRGVGICVARYLTVACLTNDQSAIEKRDMCEAGAAAVQMSSSRVQSEQAGRGKKWKVE